jgi:hypothetical protein
LVAGSKGKPKKVFLFDLIAGSIRENEGKSEYGKGEECDARNVIQLKCSKIS